MSVFLLSLLMSFSIVGDVNCDDVVNVIDIANIVTGDYSDQTAADVNDDGVVNGADVAFLSHIVFN